MLHLFTGTDRAKARAAMDALAAKVGKKRTRFVVTDAHRPDDLRAVLSGGGMFAEERTVVLDGVLGNPEMRPFVIDSLQVLAGSDDVFLLFEEKLDAVTKKQIEKYAEESSKFDAAKKEEGSTIFAIGNALKRGDKKAAWIALQRELISGKAPEAIHGILFWAAKDMTLKARTDAEKQRGKDLVVELAELPHRARRDGFELEFALERFLLSRA